MVEKKEYSFELHEDLLNTIGREFGAEEIARRFCESVKGKSGEDLSALGERLFAEYGEKWGRRCVELGETYMDRTYEILKEAIDQTGSPAFPLVPQRFLEIAYLGVQDFATLPIIENNSKRLIYRVEDCKTYREIGRNCGEDTARMLCCRHGCLALCRSAISGLQLEGVSEEMAAQTPEQGYCEFVLVKEAAK
jgi:hypothetical protein